MTDAECKSVIDSMIESMKTFGDHMSNVVRDVTLNPKDYIKLFNASQHKADFESKDRLPIIPFAHLSHIPVYVDADVPEGVPEFNRQRDYSLEKL